VTRSASGHAVQVNTSGEESKFGVDPEECLGLCRHVHAECAHLELAGLMTIGMPDYTSRPENFTCLQRCREQVAKELGLEVRCNTQHAQIPAAETFAPCPSRLPLTLASACNTCRWTAWSSAWACPAISSLRCASPAQPRCGLVCVVSLCTDSVAAMGVCFSDCDGQH
jgi:hypothetical protein